MKIRKLYRFESAHIVLNCKSERCSQNYHGHSGIVEVFLKCSNEKSIPKLDNGGMVIDFGELKNNIGSFIDMFDHAIHLWSEGSKEDLEFYKKKNSRYIIMPCNPTAENYALLFKNCINELIHSYIIFTNGENAWCDGVRYHETATGYAESESEDSFIYSLKDLQFSDRCVEESSDFMKKVLKDIGNYGNN